MLSRFTAAKSDGGRPWCGVAAIAFFGIAAYADSFRGAFQFDDMPAVVDNPTIRSVRTALSPPAGALTVSGRPVVNLSLAINYAISRSAIWSYHATNLLIHLGCAWLLYGLIRRTLERRSPAHANAIALTAALLWSVHPLTTEAVTYIVQRAESLTTFFYLLTLYAFVRGTDGMRRPPTPPASTPLGRAAEGETKFLFTSSAAGVGGDGHGELGGRRVAPRPAISWLILSWCACAAGMATKEIMVSAPIAVALYDRTFMAGSWRDALRLRWKFYLPLAGTWGLLLALMAANGWDRGATAGFHVGISWWPYWLSQGEAFARYLWLSLWPCPLAFDYGSPTAPHALALVLFILLCAALVATAIGCIRGRPWAFLPACAFMILAPTSVMPGVLQFASEHRMYLPLAAVLITVVLAACKRLPRGNGALSPLLAIVVALAALTARRNLTYRSDLILWWDTVAKRPQSATAQADLGHSLLTRNRVAEAIPYCVEAVRLDPKRPTARYNLGLAYEQDSKWNDALFQFVAAADLNPKLFYATFHAGRLLDRLNRPAEAEYYLHQALAEAPDLPDAHGSLGVAEAALGHTREAIAEFTTSLRLNPNQPEVEYNLGLAFARQGDLATAATHYASAGRLQSDYWQADLNLGVADAQLGHLPEAEKALRSAIRLKPSSAEAHSGLATVLDSADRLPEAIAEYRTALRLRTDYPEAHYNLGNALLRQHDLRGARAEFTEAVREAPNFSAAREMLARLDAFGH